jgi:DHA1 family multidrug resistance protein-like MFS transporter
VQTAHRLGPALGPVIGGAVAQMVGIRNAFFVSACFYVVALLLVLVLYREQLQGAQVRTPGRGPIRFRDLLAFENFLLLMMVIFLVQLVDRSFGPVLPLFLGQIGVGDARIALVAGVLFSEVAFAAALGHHLTGRLLARTTPRTLLSAAAGTAGVAAAVYALAPPVAVLLMISPLLGIAVGVAMTTAYSSAGRMIPQGAGGAGFGLLTTASLTGLAISPMLSGLLGATSIRAVFALDAAIMGALAIWVRRSMAGGRGEISETSGTEGILADPSAQSAEAAIAARGPRDEAI